MGVTGDYVQDPFIDDVAGDYVAPLSRLPRTTTGKPRLRDVRLVAVIRRGNIVTGHVVDERVLNVVARDVVDCLEVFVPPPGALSTVEPATRVHAVSSNDVRLLAVAFAFVFFAFFAFLAGQAAAGAGLRQ